MRWLRGGAIGVAAAFFLAQLLPVEQTNPPVDAEIAVADPEAHGLLRRACYDCHSHATVWPWYASVAPVSWLLSHHVEDARDELNFSRFESYDRARQRKKLGELAEEVEEHHMPLWSYVLLHPEAALSDAERERLVKWAHAEQQRRAAPGQPAAP